MPKKQLQLEASISSSDVTLGQGKKSQNKIVVKLVNTSDQHLELPGRGDQGTLFLTASVGTRAEDFVDGLDDASGVKIVPAANWKQAPYKTKTSPDKTPPDKPSPDKIELSWSFVLPANILKAKADTSLTLTDFECETDPGKAKLALRVAISGYDDYEKTLEVEKKDPNVLQILYFKADPPFIITQKDRKSFVALEWNTIKAHTVSLSRANVPILTLQEGDAFQNKKKYSYLADPPSETDTAVYKLVVTDRTDPKIEQEKEVTVRVLKRGWRSLTEFGPRFGYPSVLCNMDGVKLYGIWMKNGKASLFSSTHPWVTWNPENGNVPEKMSTSPAVCFLNRLWLVGGGAIDTRKCSNQVWSYKPGGWVRHKDAEWRPRMGHACLVMNDQIWILGGMLEDGNSLNEVWSWDGEGEWKRHKNAAWSKRCLQAATNFPAMIEVNEDGEEGFQKRKIVPVDRIWIYGGVTEPYGDPLDDMWTSSDGENWEPYPSETTVDYKPPGGKPMGCALQVVNGKLHLLGTFRSGAETPSTHFVLDEAHYEWRPSPVLFDGSWHRQVGSTFSLSSVEYKGLVFARSLYYETPEDDELPALNLFVP
jgi:hypothetical protein